MDAQRPVPRLWIRSAEVRGGGGGGGGGGMSLGEWEHNNNNNESLATVIVLPRTQQIITLNK